MDGDETSRYVTELSCWWWRRRMFCDGLYIARAYVCGYDPLNSHILLHHHSCTLIIYSLVGDGEVIFFSIFFFYMYSRQRHFFLKFVIKKKKKRKKNLNLLRALLFFPSLHSCPSTDNTTRVDIFRLYYNVRSIE